MPTNAERTVVVTYNPLTATKQRYAFEAKLQKLQAVLYEMRAKVRDDSRMDPGKQGACALRADCAV
jgi:hypothetical protein